MGQIISLYQTLMFFTNHHKIKKLPQDLIDGHIVMNPEQVKYLGFVLELNLGFNMHIKNV